MGYDAASVNDIAREAGVSKGTIYVYFSSKEDLFEELMDEVRESLFRELEAELERPGTLKDRLLRYATVLATRLCSDRVIRAHRVIIGVTERMPEIGARFYDRGATRGTRLLVGFLEPEVAAGRLTIPDIPLAASQFFELCMVGLFRPRLLGHMPAPPTEAEVARIVSAGVDMFLCRYSAPVGR
ncbi:fatty acid metabolism regulator protein [mine drainage metagenome]|uniref:Fatty acid metabolism regulator protein n=1 Tax=mine drainage metagenome TaxID=410659 RepID=A0A1J5PRX5_9ZZZZ